MAQINHLISSFNSGELTPEMDRRLGVEKVASGCRILENFIPRVHGPAFKRPGMVYLGEAYSQADGEKSRLISFNFSTTTSFIIELYAGGARIWSNGYLVPLDAPISLPYIELELFQVQVAQVNDVVYLSHPSHPPHKLIRRSDTNWETGPLFDIGVNTPTTGVTPGVAGQAPVDQWVPWAGTYPTNTTTTTTIRNQAAASNAPTSVLTVTTGAMPATSQTYFARRMRAKFVVPTTGVWTIYNNTSGAGAAIYINEVYVVGSWQGQIAENSATINLTAGKEYALEYWTWNILGTYGGTMKLAGPGFPKADLPASMISEPDTTTSVTTREELRQYPPMLSENVTETTITPSATSGSITITASMPIFQQGHEGAYWEIAHRREDSIAEIIGAGSSAPGTPFSGTSTPLRIVGDWDFYTYGTWAGTVYLERQNAAGSWDVVRSWKSNKDRNVIATGTEEQESQLRIRVVDGVGEAASGAAVPRFLLEAADAQITGLIRITDVTSPTVATADVITSLHSTAATVIWTEGAFSAYRGYPRAIAMHQQRLLFAGTSAYAKGIWGSVANDLENFRRTTLDDGSFFFQLASEEANAIQWMVSYSRLLLGTSGELWSADGGSDGNALNSVNVRFTQGGRFGSAYLPAVLVHEVPVFVERTGRKVRRVTYSQEEEKYIGSNLTVLSEHVTVGGITQLAFQQQPNAILWCTTGAGELVGMTFENEQNVYGWSRHNTDGVIESVAVVYGTDADEVWVSVLRTINGANRRYIERFDPTSMEMDFSDPAELIYCDAAIRVEPDGTDAVSVPHLAGETIVGLADGAELSPIVVGGDGAVTLDRDDYEVVILGLPYTATLQPWRQEFGMQKGTAQGAPCKVASMVVMLHESMGGQVADSPEETPQRIDYRDVSDLMDTAIPLFSGERHVKPRTNHRESVDLVIESTEPFPFNVTAVVVKLDVYDR